MDIVRRKDSRGGPLGRLRGEMDDLFRRFFDGWDWPLTRFGEGAWLPAIDVAEHDDAFVVKAELPGLRKEDFEISVQDNVLTLAGEKKETQEEKGETWYHVESRCGSFRRDISLPAGVDAEHVEAKYQDGVLTIRLPKTEQAKARRIEVTT